jgi:hypothetical protein
VIDFARLTATTPGVGSGKRQQYPDIRHDHKARAADARPSLYRVPRHKGEKLSPIAASTGGIIHCR